MFYISTKLNKWCQYIKLRFPVVPLALFTFIVGVSSEKVLVGYVDYKAVIVGILLLLFFFHLRLLDELKDFEFDSVFHKDRPVQSGLISLADIKVALIVNLVFLLVLTHSMGHLIIFMITMIYTALMFKEFFIQSFYDRTPLLYLISHEIVFVPLYIFLFSYYTELLLPPNYASSLAIVYFIIPVTLIEIGRKMKHRYDQDGKPTKDTYIYIWGEKLTISVFMTLCVINSVILGTLTQRPFGYAMSAGFIFFAVGALVHKKIRNLIISNNMSITTLCALVFPLLLLI